MKNMTRMTRQRTSPILIAILLSILLLFSSGCREKEYILSGRTMGTTYNIRLVTDRSPERLQEKIAARLGAINRSMSTYDPESEISRFNEWVDIDAPFEISYDFMQVMIMARELYRLTGGAWDGTVDPLVTLWGFGREGSVIEPPPEEAIESRSALVGFDRIEMLENRRLKKKIPEVTLDLASVAKGYGVDQISELLEKEGVHNYLVEIGGEIFVSGTQADGKPWRVGINLPLPGAQTHAVYHAFSLETGALATSGNYRLFFEIEGKRYSHIIDPRTGYPANTGVVSASVIADTCTFADGLATALMVMGPEQGIALIESLEDVECMVVILRPNGTLKDHFSSGFPGYAPPPS